MTKCEFLHTEYATFTVHSKVSRDKRRSHVLGVRVCVCVCCVVCTTIAKLGRTSNFMKRKWEIVSLFLNVFVCRHFRCCCCCYFSGGRIHGTANIPMWWNAMRWKMIKNKRSKLNRWPNSRKYWVLMYVCVCVELWMSNAFMIVVCTLLL